MKHNTLLIISLLVLSFMPACAKKNEQGQDLKKRLLEIAKRNHIPTLSVLIKAPNTDLEFYYQDKDKGIKYIDSYGLASTTKMLASVLVLKQVEEGKLQLNDLLTRYIDATEFKNIAWFGEIRVRDLLNHTSGIPDYTKSPKYMELVMAGNGPKTYTDKVQLITQSDTDIAYGVYAYSNSNYILLEKIVETITGKKAQQAFNEFYTSQALPNVSFPIGDDINQAFFAQESNGVGDVSNWQEHYGFDGGAFAKAADLARFLEILFINKTMLQQSSLDEMSIWTDINKYVINYGFAKMSAYGLGLMKYEFDGRTWLGHAGSSLKYQCFTFIEPSTGAKIILHTNSSGRHYNNAFFISLLQEITKEV